jgi:hypothetical protein
MRLRADSGFIAGWKFGHDRVGCQCGPDLNHVAHIARYADIAPAELGDVWPITSSDGSTIGYILTCPNPACSRGVHAWTHAGNCEHRDHAPHQSCWTWTGSPEDGTLTATPSLQVIASGPGDCSWHGWLRAGEMVVA